MTSPASRRLLLFGKIPAAGRTKTRLAPLLGAEGAAALYRAFLDDAVAMALRVGGVSVELWLEPPAPGEPGPGRRSALPAGPPGGPGAAGSGGEAARLSRRYGGIPVRWQEGEGLGARLATAFDRAFREGAERTMAVGSDHPTLPARLLEEGFEGLARAELVLGPSRDGGYYAIGLSRPAWPRASALFRGIPWSTGEVAARTRARASELGLRAVELAEWYDVDDPEDLELLKRDVSPGSRTARILARLGEES